MIFGWIAVGIIVYYLHKGKVVSTSKVDSAENILKFRFVNGEIDEETYLKMKSVINK
jgi:uncharacterized membrane protein